MAKGVDAGPALCQPDRVDGSPDLPAGFVSFVFTDIEGSTRLLRDGPDGYDALLDLHDAVLRAVWARHHGYVVGTEGDSFLVAFARPTDAVTAVADAQRSVTATSWPGRLPVRIRAGVHTGYALPNAGAYRALALHQAARVTAAAHGGQALVSDDTVRRLEGVPDDVLVEPVGRFRLRDFDEPVLLHRVRGDGIPLVATAPRVRPADGHNLVVPSTSLVGREGDVVAVAALLDPSRLVTLIGPGGVGKTRLAVEIALGAVPQWPDGVWFVDLAPVTTAAGVASAVAGAVGAPSAPGRDPWDDVCEFVRGRRMLVVLDNCEHLVEAVAKAVLGLTDRSADTGVLATSRVPLGLRIERAYRLGPLVGASDPGVELFLQRAAVTADLDRRSVAELVDELDGLPLAIELAAARTTALSAADILARLRSTMSVLTSRDPALPERQRSLDRLLDWSFDLLDVPARSVLLQLGAFAGGFDLASAEALCGSAEVPRDDVAELLWSLMDQSLVVGEAAAGTTRFRLPATVRSYTRDRLATGPAFDVALRLAGIYIDRLGPGRSDDGSWPGEMALELDNVRHVARQLAGREDELAQRLAWCLGRYHDRVDAYRAGIEETDDWSRVLLSPSPARVALLTLLADLHLRVAELDEAAASLVGAEALAAQVGAPGWDDAGTARTAGELMLRRGDAAGAGQIAEHALALTASPRGRARLWNLVGISRVLEGRLTEAVDVFEAELTASDEGGVESFTATTHGNIAEAQLQLGELGSAARHQRTSLQLARAQGEPVQVAFSLMVAARIGRDLRRPPREAVKLQSVADRLLAEAGYVLYAEDLEPREELLTTAEEELGESAFRRAVSEGSTADVDATADLADAVLAQAARPATVPRSRTPSSAGRPVGGPR